jgi:phage terminase large subunit-like protein
MCGRGWGKTWVGSNWIIEQALTQPGSVWAVVAPTFRDVRATCFEGPSGIRRNLEPGVEDQWRRNELRLDLINGSIIYGFSADQPERLRGTNLSGAWCDELGSWRYPETWYEGLIPALRIGEHPRVVVTTTPRPTKLVKELYQRRDGTVHVTRAATWENSKNLSATALEEMRARYEGTRLGRQELEGELLEDLEGALWSRADIDAARIKPGDVPDLVRIVVAIDPAVTSNEESDETGIVVAGDDGKGHGYILADLSMMGTPEQCMRKAVNAYHHYGADCVVAETNNGGDYLGAVLRAQDPNVPYRTVRASRGKAIRAEPVSALAEQHRLHHVGNFPELEDQMCNLTPGISNGPDDRVDAAVWAVMELRGLSTASWLQAYGVHKCERCAKPIKETEEQCSGCGFKREIEPIPERDDDFEAAPGSWAAIYNLQRCEKGHSYRGSKRTCPHCMQEAFAFLKSSGNPVGR